MQSSPQQQQCQGAHSSALSQFRLDIDPIFRELEQVNIALPVCDLACPVCLSVTSDPRLLMCGHRICMGCATRLTTTTTTTTAQRPGYANATINSTINATIKCPTCSSVGSSQTIPDIRTRDIVLSQTVVCGYKGCSEVCNLRDVLGHMKRCKFRIDDRSVLNGAVKRCRDEIDTLKEGAECKRRRYRDVHRVVTAYNNEMSKKEIEIVDKSIVSQAVGKFMTGLSHAVGDKCFKRIYKAECEDYQQSLVNKVKAATTA